MRPARCALPTHEAAGHSPLTYVATVVTVEAMTIILTAKTTKSMMKVWKIIPVNVSRDRCSRDPVIPGGRVGQHDPARGGWLGGMERCVAGGRLGAGDGGVGVVGYGHNVLL